jgi:hypothetical protein
VVGDGHLVCVSAQVFQHCLGMIEGALGIDDPLFLEELVDQIIVVSID